jgi:peptidoglycan/xylan/chitin deacetylase (PgdA/CDA1 family)
MTALISLSFDDGWKSSVERGASILDQAGIRATFYVMVSPPETGFANAAYATPDQIRALHAAGHEVGSHTISHPHLPDLSADAAREEIVGSAESLRKWNLPIDTFAYPYGEHTPAVVDMVREAGYLGARGTRPGYNDASSDRFLLNCLTVNITTSFASVRRWIDAARVGNRWLILMFHQIEPTTVALAKGNALFGTTTGLLAQIANYLDSEQMEAVTVRDGLRRVFGESRGRGH